MTKPDDIVVPEMTTGKESARVHASLSLVSVTVCVSLLNRHTSTHFTNPCFHHLSERSRPIC